MFMPKFDIKAYDIGTDITCLQVVLIISSIILGNFNQLNDNFLRCLKKNLCFAVFVSIWMRAWLPYLPNSLWIQCGRSLEACPLQLKHVFMLNFVSLRTPITALYQYFRRAKPNDFEIKKGPFFIIWDGISFFPKKSKFLIWILVNLHIILDLSRAPQLKHK